jgi:hypothetical protein
LRTCMKLGCKEVARGLDWEEPLAETEALYAQLLSDLSSTRTERTLAAQYERERLARFKPERSARRDLSS